MSILRKLFGGKDRTAEAATNALVPMLTMIAADDGLHENEGRVLIAHARSLAKGDAEMEALLKSLMENLPDYEPPKDPRFARSHVTMAAMIMLADNVVDDRELECLGGLAEIAGVPLHEVLSCIHEAAQLVSRLVPELTFEGQSEKILAWAARQMKVEGS